MKPTYKELLNALEEVLSTLKDMTFNEDEMEDLQVYDDLIKKAKAEATK